MRTMQIGSARNIRQRAGLAAWLLPVVFVLLAASAAAAAAERKAVRVLGDRDYPPITYLEDGIPRGFDVDVVAALGEALGWNVSIELLPWDLAQKEVLDGKADFVTAMGVTQARRALWDFATPTLAHNYQLFVTTGEMGIRGEADLAGKRVGVTAGGLPRRYFEKRPDVGIVVVANYEEGFDLLRKGLIDAVAAEAWVAGYLINKKRIEGIAAAGAPFARLDAAIAVPRGNAALLQEVNRGLRLLDQRGTIAEIRARWEPKQVVYLLKEEVQAITVLAAGAAALVVFAGMVAWILTLRREIAVRRLIEKELRTSEERFRAVFEQAAVGISLRPAGTRTAPFLRVNQKLCDILGYTREELLELPVTALSPEDDQETANDYNRRVLSGELPSYSREKRYLRKDGQIIWTNVVLSGVLGAEGRPSHLITVIQDITEQKRAVEALRMRQAKIESIFRGVPVGIGEVVDRVLTVANDRLCQMLGYAPDELVGKSSRMVYLSHDEWERVGRVIDEQARGRGTGTTETRWRRKDGRVIDVLVSVTAIEPGNRDAGVTVTALDITERKRADQELARHREHLEDLVRERTAELEAANRELQAFSYTVSHDLRAPLRAIIGFSGILGKKATDAEEQQFLARIERNAQRLGQMVDDLLDFSRLGRGELTVQRFDPNPLVAEVIESVRASYPHATVTAAPLPAMTGDRGLLQQVFENLVGNALKFSAKVEKPAVEVGVQQVNGETVFFVRDNGAGFDMKYSDELYTVFKRLHPREEFDGSGVGLATVHRIVTRHGGRVWAESAPRAGATFYFTLKSA